MADTVRVRFAPAPTGMMHLGNVRTALMNYLFARKKGGSFILRIEDTDATRNIDADARMIIADLDWLGLSFDEGPDKGGPCAPYFQSQRTSIYQEKLIQLEEKGALYRCFCSVEELEKKRLRQQALKLPPRYDRTCTHLTKEVIATRLAQATPFVWRVKLMADRSIKIHDLAHGIVTFDLNHFSDFPITREDGSFTFIFANFVDDLTMKISHVFRGQEHLSNTAGQALLYELFNTESPIFWHMPLICDINGKKLSKRDFGFSLRDLQDAGFIPEAICNYLAIIGGSFEQEIMSLQELAATLNLDQPQTSGQIKYDVEKLKWVNHKWVTRFTPEELTRRCRPFLKAAYPAVATMTDEQLNALLIPIQTDLITLKDAVLATQFYFQAPNVSTMDIDACIPSDYKQQIAIIVKAHLSTINNATGFVDTLKTIAKEQNVPLKLFFFFLRLVLTGSTHGPAVHILIDMLGAKEAEKRILHGLNLITGKD